MIFREIEEGRESNEVLFMRAYGTYLSNGGNPDTFMDLTSDEVFLMQIVDKAKQSHAVNTIVEILKKMFGGTSIR